MESSRPPSDAAELSFWLWDQFQNSLDKDPLLVGVSLCALGQGMHVIAPDAKEGGLSPGHRVQYVGVGLMSMASGDDALFGVATDVTGMTMVMAGITNVDIPETTREKIETALPEGSFTRNVLKKLWEGRWNPLTIN